MLLRTTLGFLALFWFSGSLFAQVVAHPKHLIEAEKLVRHLKLEHTSYNHGEQKVVWTGTCASHADCSGFVDNLLTHSYGYDANTYKRWFDSHRPSARRYHDAIVDQRGFTLIKRLSDVRPGDFLAVKYLIQKENTGHVMLATKAPRQIELKKPLVDGTEQWEIQVIDSSKSGHGPTDTRHKKGPDGKDHAGLGEGIIRVYTGRDASIVGFTWSTYTNSQFQPPSEEHLVIGRLIPNFQP